MTHHDQSIEDMLSMLEGTGTSGGNYQSSGDHGITDIDDFLSKLEADSAQNRQNPRVSQLIDDFDDLGIDDYSQPTYSAPVQSRPQSFAQPPAQSRGPSMASQPARAHQSAVAKPAPPPQQQRPQSYAQPNQTGGAPVDHNGERLLLDEGYTRHNNKGKFVNYRGRASDFRIKGTTSSRVGLIHVITLRALDDNCEPCAITELNPRDFIGATLTLNETGRDIQPWFKDNGDATYDIAFYAEVHGTVQLVIKLAGSPMFDIAIQVDPSGDSLWVALLQNQDVQPHDLVVVAIVTTDDSRPEGVVPFEVQTMGDVSDLKLMNNGDGTYRFQCIPQSAGHCTINITLHEQPIQNSPLTFKVGQEQKAFIKQTVTVAPRSTPAQSNYQQPQPSYQQPQQPRATQSNFQQPSQAVRSNASSFQQPAAGNRQSVQQPAARPQSTYGHPSQAARPQSQYGGQGYDQGYDDQYSDPQYGNGYDFDGRFDQGQGGNVTNDDLNRLLDELGGGL